jgi:AraC-like DNA-binding protein
MSTASTILLLGLIQGAIVVGTLLATKRDYLAHRFLAALIFLVSLKLVPYVLGFSGFYQQYPWLSYAPFELESGFGPLLYFFVLTRTAEKLPKGWGWHLVPLAIEAVYYSVMFLQPLEFKDSWHGRVQVFIDPLDGYWGLISLCAYLWLSLRRTRDYEAFTQQNMTQEAPLTVRFLTVTLWTFAAFLMVDLVFQVVTEFRPNSTYFDRYPLYLCNAIVVYIIGNGALRLRDPVPQITIEPTAEPLPASVPAPKDWAKVADQIEERCRQQKLWQDPQLTLALFADAVKFSPSYVSKALNNARNESFNAFINRLRVEEMTTLLRNPAEDRDMIELAFECGFNSKASFNRSFKQITGQTPTAFRERVPSDAEPTP